MTEQADKTPGSGSVMNIKRLHLEMGMQCNVRCAMCYQTTFAPSTKMPEAVWKEKLLPAYSSANWLTLQGGEPTILPNCRALLEMAVREYPNLQLITVTNGQVLSELWQEAFLKQGRCLNFSLNAVGPELYAKIVAYGKQDRTIANIDRMVKRKATSGSSVTLRISSVVLDETVDEIPAFAQWAVDHGLDEVLFHPDMARSIRREPDLVHRKIAETYEIMDRNPQVRMICLDDFDWAYSRHHGISPVRPRQVFDRPAVPCGEAFDGLFVDYRGIARPCCRSWYSYGDLKSLSLEEVWNSRAANTFRERMSRLDFRDCVVTCDLNFRPIHPRVALLRKAYWVVRRDPRAAAAKGMRKFGLTNAQKSK